MHLITFTNLFPSSVMPTHGVFVYERMRRVAARLRDDGEGFRWSVLAPVPHVIGPLRRGAFRRWAEVPLRESFDGIDVHHPRFRHWPGLSQNRQADAVARGSRALLQELVRSSQAPVVLDAHYLWPDGVAAAALAQELGVPFTLTARGSDVNVLGQQRTIAQRIAAAAAGAHACMAVSDALSTAFAQVAGLAREQVQTVRNGVDLERFRPPRGDERAAARRAFGMPAAGDVVLGVGRLVAGKGFVAAARAVARLDGVQLVLVGDGPERAAIEAAGGEAVRCLGALDPEQVAAACRAADAFVLPSHREGWPNVVTEALASGLPVVATRVGGIPQILAGDPPSPGLGALIDVGDVDGLTAALRAVLAAGITKSDVRAFAERYGWQEPVEQLARTFVGAAQASR